MCHLTRRVPRPRGCRGYHGVRETDSDVATALRTLVVLAFAWVMAAITAGGLVSALAAISARSFAFLALIVAGTTAMTVWK